MGLAKFIPNIAEKTKPIRELLHKDNLWYWTQVHEHAFKMLKQLLTSDKVLTPYDPNKKSMLGSYGVNTLSDVNSCFNILNACSCTCVQYHKLSLWRSSLIGLVFSAIFGINFANPM